MTDPVPYEPAENIPPIILPGITPDPSTLVVREAAPADNIEITLEVPILEYNLDDTLYYGLVWDSCPLATDPRGTEKLLGRYSRPPPPERTRTRTFSQTVTLSPARLGSSSGVYCGRLLLVVSDRGWFANTPPLCSPPQDADGKDVTVVPIVVWWIWKNDGTTTDGPGVRTCDPSSPSS